MTQPFDFNSSIKLELGSTVERRTLIHYLEVVSALFRESSTLDRAMVGERSRSRRDPLTAWAAKIFVENDRPSLDQFLRQALERRNSASPYESFITGGGVHGFHNFDSADKGRISSVREGFQRPVNLVFIRLMHDLALYHQARLPYDSDELLANADHPLRRQMLDEIAAKESLTLLQRAYRSYHELPVDELVKRFLGTRASSPRHLVILFFAWKQGRDEASLAQWVKAHAREITPTEADKLFKAYANPQLTIADYGYLLARNSLEVWAAGQLMHDPTLAWQDLAARSGAAQRISSAWLFQTRNRRAQEMRLRIRFEEEAFQRMTPYWRRLGFPFERLVPSLATAIGNSSDRPLALAELMGVIVNHGVRRPHHRDSRVALCAGHSLRNRAATR